MSDLPPFDSGSQKTIGMDEPGVIPNHVVGGDDAVGSHLLGRGPDSDYEPEPLVFDARGLSLMLQMGAVGLGMVGVLAAVLWRFWVQRPVFASVVGGVVILVFGGLALALFTRSRLQRRRWAKASEGDVSHD